MHASVNGTDLFFDVDGARLRLGPGGLSAVPTIVVLHGGPGFDQGYLRPGIGALRDEAQLLFVDLRGQGRSGPAALGTCTLEQMAEDVVALCTALGLDRPILLGHSAGGFVALHAALRWHGVFGGLILCNTAAVLGQADPDIPSLLERAGTEAAEVAGRVFAGDVSVDAGLAFERLVVPHYGGPGHTDVPGRLFPLSSRSVEVMEQFFGGDGAARYDLRPRLGEIVVPTLVVAGAYDWVLTPRAARTLADGIPGAELAVIPAAGHFPFSEEPAHFHHAVTTFLCRIEPGDSPPPR